MPKISFIIVVLSIFAISTCYGQTNDCLQLYCIDGEVDTLRLDQCGNPDSVMVDTCMSSTTNNQAYSKRWYYIRFKDYVIDLPPAPFDTTLEVSWTSIDTSYHTLRTGFSQLEAKYGTLHLKKYAANRTDSADPASHVYYMRFSNYTCVDSVLNDIAGIDGIEKYYFNSYPHWLLSAGKNTKSIRKAVSIYPNPSSTTVVVGRNDGVEIREITLIDVSGSVLIKKEYTGQRSITLDVHSLKSGLYVMLIDGESYDFIVTK